MNGRDLIRWLTPHGLIEAHRMRFRLGRLGLPSDLETLAAAESCRYELWPKFLRWGAAPWTLVDVGANDGDFVGAVGRLTKLRSAHVFEPLPTCHPALERTLKKLEHARLYRCAVGANAGEVDIHFTGDSKMSSALLPKAGIAAAYRAGDFSVQQKIRVPLVTLDEALAEVDTIDLLKVDVQGFEMEVFLGAEKTLARSRAVLLEVNYVQHYEGAATFDAAFAHLSARGFRVFGISAPYGSAEMGPLWADAMFVHSKE